MTREGVGTEGEGQEHVRWLPVEPDLRLKIRSLGWVGREICQTLISEPYSRTLFSPPLINLPSTTSDRALAICLRIIDTPPWPNIQGRCLANYNDHLTLDRNSGSMNVTGIDRKGAEVLLSSDCKLPV
jgi:hypothetical protein